jgi:hypothetical protein
MMRSVLADRFAAASPGSIHQNPAISFPMTSAGGTDICDKSLKSTSEDKSRE